MAASDAAIEPGSEFAAIQRDGFRRDNPEQLALLCKSWFRRRHWGEDWGPKPGEAGSFVPEEFAAKWLAEDGAKVVQLHGAPRKAG